MSSKEDPEWNTLTQRFNYEDESGQMYEKNPVTNAWLPIIDEEQIKAQQAAYSVPGVDETEDVVAPRKRKIQETFTSAPGEEEAEHAQKHKKERSTPKTNETAVYVERLPPDTTEEELATVFGKCGLILEDPVTGRPRIKIYTDSAGRQKGDALIIYFRAESVSLAIALLHESSLRGDEHLIKVSKASFDHKKGKKEEGEAKKPVSETVRKKGSQKASQLKSKLADWDEEGVKEVPKPSKLDKTVILKGMFTLDELESDPTLLLELKDDVREECGRLGEVTNVTLFDREPNGIMSIKFKSGEDALACIKRMHGRFFGGRQIVAELSDGQRRYKKTGKHAGEEDEQEDDRLEKFGSWLEGGDEEQVA